MEFARECEKKLDNIITPEIFNLMKKEKSFLLLLDNYKVITKDEDINTWNVEHGICDIPRVIGHKTECNSGEDIYVLHHTDDVGSILIPMGMIKNNELKDFKKLI